MKVGLLTGGGDCPGLNAVIRAVVQKIHNAGGECLGILEGWRGLVEGHAQPLHPRETDQIIGVGGTILGSSRTNPLKDDNVQRDLPKLQQNFKKWGLDAVVAIGGDDTLGVAQKLHDQHDLPMVGVPKTIDNDLMVTDFTFGFDTAVNIVVESVDRLRTTTESHRRICVVETMGRHAGWIACFSGIAVGADYIMVPEVQPNIDHCVSLLKERRRVGKNFGMVIVSEGTTLPSGLVTQSGEIDAFGHVRLGGIGNIVANLIEQRTGIETRAVILGHLQRGGAPSAFDRVLATRLGLQAAQLVLERRFGTMVALKGTQIIDTTLAEGVSGAKTLDLSYFEEASVFFQ